MKDEVFPGAADVCRWFAGLYLREVTPPQLAAYREGGADPFLHYVQSLCDVREDCTRFRDAVAMLGGFENPVRTLAADFAELFLLGERGNPQPYASLFREAETQAFGATHDRMVARLEARGLAPAGETNEPADHLSYMLEYAAELLSSGERGAAAEFLANEVVPWIGRWKTAAANARPHSQFYPSLIALTCAYAEALAQPAQNTG